jgi:iron complex outermembrane receptor protein
MRKSLNSFRLSLFIILGHVFSAPVIAAEPTDLEPIVVVQSPYGGASRGPVTAVLTQEDIQKVRANSPEDLLNYLGVDVQARGAYGVKSDISLNASTFQQVLVLVNGTRVKDPQTAHHDLDLFFTVDDIERIEVIPAARSSIYGPDGSGGAVNFILKKPGHERNSISASGGNHATYEQKIDLGYDILKVKNRFSFANSASGGSRFDSDFRTDTFFNASSWEGDDASVYLDTGYNEKEFGAYDFYTPNRGFPSKEWTNTKFVDLRAVVKKERFTFEPHANFREHFDKFMLSILNPALSLNHHRTDTYGGGGVLKAPYSGGDFVFGADVGEERIISKNLGKHTRGHWNAYIDPSFEINSNSTLNVALRVDDYTTFQEEVTGSLSLKHLINEESDGYVTVGRAIRVPTFTELYYSDPTTAGNINLKPEQAYNAEAGYHRRLAKDVDGTFSFFVRQEYDTIDFTKLTSADPRFIARNISDAFVFGLNAFAKWQVSEKTSLDLRYFFANKRQKGDSLIYKYGLNLLKHMIDLGMDSKLPFGRNRADIIMKKKPDRREWVLLNDRLAFDVRKDVELFCEVYNLLNVEFQEIAGVPQEGRQFKFGMKFTW